jgi:hypothetical protein
MLSHISKEDQCCLMFQSGIAKNRNDIGWKRAPMRVDDLAKHKTAGTASADRKQRWASDVVWISNHC